MGKSVLEEKLEKSSIVNLKGNDKKDYSKGFKVRSNGGVENSITIDDIKSVQDVKIFVDHFQDVIKNIENKNGSIEKQNELKEKIEYNNKLIEKLKSEGEERNKDMIDRATDRIKATEEELKRFNETVIIKDGRIATQQEIEEFQKNNPDGKRFGREVTRKEAGEMLKHNIEDAVRAFLTQKAKNIETKEIPEKQKEIADKLKSKKQELDVKEKDRRDFKYLFDANHNITNKADLEKLDKDIEKLRKEVEELKSGKELNELIKIKEACEKSIQKLYGPSLEELQEKAKAREQQDQPQQQPKQQDKAYDFIENTEWNGNYEVVDGFKLPQYGEKNPENDINVKEKSYWSDKYETADVAVNDKEQEKIIAFKGADGTSDRFMAYGYENDKKADYFAYESKKDFFKGKTYKECFERVQQEFGFDKKMMKKVDPYLFSFLLDNNQDLANEMAMEVIQGHSLEKYADKIQYDIKGVEKLKKENKEMWKEYKKIAKIAEANGFEVIGIEETRNVFDKIGGLFKKKKAPKAIKGATEPQKLDAGKEPETGDSKAAAQEFKGVYEFHYTPEELNNIAKKASEPNKEPDKDGREPGE